MQIVSSGINDVFLTIDPQITFFKIVYMRHTPFAIDLNEEYFNTIPNFGDEAICQLSKNGDLLSNIFLKVILPNVQISKTLDNDLIVNSINPSDLVNDTTITGQISEFKSLLSSYTQFMSSAMVYWRAIKNIINNVTSNYTTINAFITNILKSGDSILNTYNNSASNFTSIIISGTAFQFNFDILNHILNDFIEYKNSIYNTTLTAQYIGLINNYLSDYLKYQTIYLKEIIDQQQLFINLQQKYKSTYYNFAWVSKIAFAIINNISIEIGGQVIDHVNSDILNCWYELSLTLEKQKLLNKMIGNIDILTTYDNNLVPTYTLIMPIPFWFCKYKSQAIACTGLKYHDIIIRLKLNELYTCCYFEPTESNIYSSNININEIIQIQQVSLLVEYIHVGDDERKKFGSYANESLIEQHQFLEFNQLIKSTNLIPLNFVNPVRELIWVVQKANNINNFKLWNDYSNIDIFSGTINSVSNDPKYINQIIININNLHITNYQDYLTGCIEIYHSKFYNGFYSISYIDTNIIIINCKKFYYSDYINIKLYQNKYKTNYNLITNENIQIYGSDLLTIRDSIYFTTVQNYQNHTCIPKNIHSFSFCLNTELYQPSGSLNMSVIDSENLYVEFNNTIINQINTNNDNLVIKIFARSHNIFKIEQGMGKLQFGI